MTATTVLGSVLGVDRERLERDVLPDYLAQRRWFGGKGEAGLRTRLVRATPLPGAGGLVLGAVEAVTAESAATYAMPIVEGEGTALADGSLTGERGGQALRRQPEGDLR